MTVTALPVRHFDLFDVAALTPGLIMAVLLIPLWWQTMQASVARVTLVLGIVAGANGLALLMLHDHSRAVDLGNAASIYTLVAWLVVALPVCVWAVNVVGIRGTSLGFAVGILLQNILAAPPYDLSLYWKYVLAWPVTVVLLALCRSRSQMTTVTCALLVITAAAGYRSHLAVIALAVMLLVIRAPVRRDQSSTALPVGSLARRTMAIAGVTLIAYGALTALMNSGALGHSIQERNRLQTSQGAALLVAGRVEPVITIRLFQESPWGHGPGVVPNVHDFEVARAALTAADVRASEYYLDTFVFADRFKLHSFLSDLWTNFGVGGVALWVGWASFIARWLLIGRQKTDVLMVLVVAVWSGWDLLFSPLFSNVWTLPLALALISAFHPSSNRTRGRWPSSRRRRGRRTLSPASLDRASINCQPPGAENLTWVHRDRDSHRRPGTV